DETVRQRLQQLGQKRDRSPHWLMKTAIEIYLEQEEAYEREKSEDMARWEHYLLSGEAVDGDVVEPWLSALANGKNMPCPK
ncbi:MAG: CopG family ribbon-helix-helix protein, partial [Candidatus Saccharimonadales bacterium]